MGDVFLKHLHTQQLQNLWEIQLKRSLFQLKAVCLSSTQFTFLSFISQKLEDKQKQKNLNVIK